MNVSVASVDSDSALIFARGEIVPGDLKTIAAAISSVPPGRKVIGLVLNSGGGNIIEAENIASAIKRTGFAVAVQSGGECASACFLLFASASMKFAAPDALIGVHSASNIGGDETLMTMGATTAMARDLAAYNVPEEIIGRLVETAPGKIAWLTGAELSTMGVSFLNQRRAPSPASPHIEPAAAVDVTSAQPQTPNAVAVDRDFASGLSDRKAWEAWFIAQHGAFRDGALYWTTQRSLRIPGPCNDAPQDDLGALPQFVSGCETAKQNLAASDLRRRVSAQYRRGWNSF